MIARGVHIEVDILRPNVGKLFARAILARGIYWLRPVVLLPAIPGVLAPMAGMERLIPNE